MTGASSNPALVPVSNIVFGGSGANRTVTVTPAANQTGTATITVTVSDGQLSTPTSFLLTVTAVNDAPTITPIPNQTTTQGVAVGPLAFTVGDVETAAGSLTLSGGTLECDAGAGGQHHVWRQRREPDGDGDAGGGQTGTATITVTVSDGAASTPTSFLLTVTAVNTAPTISGLSAQSVAEDTATGALAVHGGRCRDGGGQSDGEREVARIRRWCRSATSSLGGSGANRTVTVTPAANQTGTATITVTVSDGQLSTRDEFPADGHRGQRSRRRSTPIANQTTTQGVAVGPLAFTVGDVETAAGSLTLSGGTSNPTLVPVGNIVFGGSGANRTVTVTPAAGQTGTATITVTVSDGTAPTPTSFQLTVNAAPASGLVAAYSFDGGHGADGGGRVGEQQCGHDQRRDVEHDGQVWRGAGV